jgi:mannosyltransferase OCH1-like enzyme
MGQLIDEFTIDQAHLVELQSIRRLPMQEQIKSLKALVKKNPDYTSSAIMLLIAMRRVGDFEKYPAVPATPDRIPRRILQFWDDPEPPADIVELMDTWQRMNKQCEYIRFDDRAAQEFLETRGFDDVLRAYRRAREPAQKADIVRLAYLAKEGGFYADADDRCISPIASFVPAGAGYVGFQEDVGTLGNNFIGAPAGHPVIGLALKMVTTALNRGDTDLLWLSTGPGVITRAFCQVIVSDDEASALLSNASIFDMGSLQRHIGLHCPVRYKISEKHWSRAVFASADRRRRLSRLEIPGRGDP